VVAGHDEPGYDRASGLTVGFEQRSNLVTDLASSPIAAADGRIAASALGQLQIFDRASVHYIGYQIRQPHARTEP